MAQYITRIRTAAGDLQIDYNALANLPEGNINVEEAVAEAIDALNLSQTYASKTHEHEIEDIAGLNDAMSELQDAISNIQDDILGILVVTADMSTNTADYNSTQILEHLNKGGDVRLKISDDLYADLRGVYGSTAMFDYISVTSNQITQRIYAVWEDGNITGSENVMSGGGAGMTEEQTEQLQANTEAIQDNVDAIQANTDAIACMNRTITGGNIVKSDQTITMTLTLDDNSEEIQVITLDDHNRPIAINGVNFEWSGFDGT